MPGFGSTFVTANVKTKIACLLTLDEATIRYRLRDSSMSNATIAEHLGVDQTPDGSPYPASYFWERTMPYIQVAIRTKTDEMAIFREYDDVAAKMAGIGDEIK